MAGGAGGVDCEPGPRGGGLWVGRRTRESGRGAGLDGDGAERPGGAAGLDHAAAGAVGGVRHGGWAGRTGRADEQIDVSSEDEPLAGVTELGSIDFGHREGLPYLRNSVGDPEAPVVIVEYSDFQ